MRFGIFTSMGNTTWANVLDLWRHLEATRWDIACVTDHFMPNNKEREGTTLEGWSTLAALSALVPRLRVGTIVLGNTYRHPAVVAKMAAQVDIISGGRLLLGLGSGWQQNEHEAYGIPFYTLRERLDPQSLTKWRGKLRRAPGNGEVEKAAREILDGMFQEFMTRGLRAANPHASGRQLHHFRLAAKSLHYALELPVAPEKPAMPIVWPTPGTSLISSIALS
jgi:alkanesulfonate monooxygenase SsuD/methylene tetrahydromethanopterin reductase-like flavin-dependent oxidoreductase (luciferase family)